EGLYWEIWDKMLSQAKRRGENGITTELLREAVTSVFIQYTRMDVYQPRDDIKDKAKEYRKRIYDYLAANNSENVDRAIATITKNVGIRMVSNLDDLKDREIIDLWKVLIKEVVEYEKSLGQ
ncbi:MAG: hypothetical protein ACTSXK_11255, partial [Promethearchaeota archaeon]